MPFRQEIIQINSIFIYLLEFEAFDPITYLDQLTDQEKERFFSFGHPKRRREFAATRILRHRIFGFKHIHYDQHGAPYIEDEGFISISHARGIVGIALCKDFRVGLDLETIDVKAMRLNEKFLSTQEKHNLNTYDTVEMTSAWSAKEVLYKLAGRKEILFKEHLNLEKTNEGFIGTIQNKEHTLKVKLRSFTFGDTIVTLNTEACEQSH